MTASLRMTHIFMTACLVLTTTGFSAEKAVSFTAEQVAAAVAKAPAAPVLEQLSNDFGLELKLVDYIDFTDPNDFHDMRDRGTSLIVDGPAGKYRETAGHRHAMVSVRWQADAIDKPHVLLWEYPDDKDRQICFFTHESGLTGKANLDWSLETGVNCGYPLPLSHKMQYHTFFFWPSDPHPVAMYMNWARAKIPAAASRLWIYRVQGDALPPLQVEEPDSENPRIFGGLHNWSLVPTRGIFGLNRATAMDHIAEYHAFRGDNIISWPVVSNNSWGFRCKIPAWDGGDKSKQGGVLVELENILAACEKHKLKFLPVFNTGYRFTINGQGDKDADPAQRRAGFEKGFKQFIDTYGQSKALYGIAFETQDLSPSYGECSLDQYTKSFGSLKKFSDYMNKIAPDLELYHFLGGKNIHSQYFYDGDEVFKRWESGQQSWSEHLAKEMENYWATYKRSPADLADNGIHTILTYQSDDYHIFDTYYQNPRAMTYWDLETSKERADLYDTRKAMVWNTFYEGWIGLTPENWWYQKLWVAPDFNPSGENALSAWTQAMHHRDRDLLMFGAWNNKGAGHEAKLRKMAKAFRSLPPAELQPVAVNGNSPVLVRSTVYKNKVYVNCINHSAFEQVISVGKQTLTLSPYSMQTLITSDATLTVSGTVNPAYTAWLKSRLDTYEKTLQSVSAMDKAATPAAYQRHLKRARDLFAQEQYQAADNALGFGVQHELALRQRILEPPAITVPSVAKAEQLGIDLDAWPKQAADWQTNGNHIAAHLFFPNAWDGAKDLSARVRACHDADNLYLGVHISDQKLTGKDTCALYFSAENYRKFAQNKEKFESNISIPIPRAQGPQEFKATFDSTGTVQRAKDGYVAVITIAKAKMPLTDNSIGFVLSVADDDATTGLNKAGWARKQALLFPHHPTFAYYADARTCVRMQLAD